VNVLPRPLAPNFHGLTVALTQHRLDQILNSDFTEQEIREFEEQWKVPVLRIANVTGKRMADGRSLDGRSGVAVSSRFGLAVIAVVKLV